MSTSKARAKRHKHVSKKGWEAKVPTFNMLDYVGSMIRILNFFNVEVDDKVKKDLALKYWKDQSLDVAGLDKLPDYEFAQAGCLAWLTKQEAELESRDLQRLETKFKELKSKIVTTTEVVVPKKKVSVQDNIEVLARKHAAEFDAADDDFCLYGESEFDAVSYLKANEISAAVAKRIGSYYVTHLKEVEDAYNKKDDQLVEGYSLFTRSHLRRYIEFVRGFISACNSSASQTKVTRKPRKRKEKSATVLVSRVKYKARDDNLNIESVHPSKIVGADDVWIFNTKYRKLFRYSSIEGSPLTVSGASIKNFNIDTSGGKIIRKPEMFFKAALAANKKQLIKMYDGVKAVAARATGRINEDCVIVKVF